MHIFSADFALEWPRPLPANLRLVGPLLPEPAQPLPAELEVRVHTNRTVSPHKGSSRPQFTSEQILSYQAHEL